jgi:hypothetical protein
MPSGSRFGVDLYWLPLGARGHCLRISGKLFEAVAARLERREPRDIYHSVLEVCVPEGRFVIEMGPVADANGAGRGVVAEGSVGTRWGARLRILRYEVRCWCRGTTAYSYAVDSPRRLTDDERLARRILALMPFVPMPVWGRDELRAGEDVVLQLAHVLAARCQRSLGGVDPATTRRPRPRLEGGRRRCPPRRGASRCA